MKKKSHTFALATGSALAVCLLFAAPAEAGRIHNRKESQQDRIARGVASGQLNARETARLESREAHIDREVSRMRANNDGTLTARQHVRIERQQDRLSRNIYREKHDGQSQ
jgi:hypothetical protein